MLIFLQYISLLGAALLLTGLVIYAGRISHAVEEQRLIEDSLCGHSYPFDFIGCSVLCYDEECRQHIEHLLSTEFDRYEVIVVLDSHSDNPLFIEIVRHFKLTKVNTPQQSDIPHSPIRGLYRSHLRAFRRVTLIDKEYISPYDNLSAAAAIAAYDYLIPINRHSRLRPRAIEQIILTITNQKERSIKLLQSMTDGLWVFHRDTIVEQRGFAPTILQRLLSHYRAITIYAPLLEPPALHPDKYRRYGTIALFFILLGALLAPNTTPGITLLAAILATLMVARYATLCINQKITFQDTLYHIGRMTSIFYRTKFLV